MSAVFPLQDNQKLAVAPDRTVWLSASAGTGKTQVLTARVLRLLLQPDVEPDSILCLTFTKAGAAEMATRVSEVLARWVRLPETQLAVELANIGAPSGPEARERARGRFAAVLDCPGGGLRIGTIHAFSQWLLGAFPVEAGLAPGTRAMEDRDRVLLARQVLADLLVEAEAQGDEATLAALEMLSLRMAEDQVSAFLLRCAGARELWFGPGAWQPPLRPRINPLVGLTPEDTGDTAALCALCSDEAFDVVCLRKCLDAQLAWNTANGGKMAEPVAAWLASDLPARLDGLASLSRALLNDKGEPKWLKNLLKVDPDYGDHVAQVMMGLDVLRERCAQIALVNLLEPALTLGRRFALAWDEAKAREGLIDFDDQIRRAAELLTRQDMAEWVRFKLDRRFDHVLVDEAQDTNAAQWAIIDALVEEFFTGEGQFADPEFGGKLRTLFVVGDYKQAIFRFQGTSPENFARAQHRVKSQLQALAEVLADETRELLDLGLARSYRTAAPILDFVDSSIAAIGPERFGPIPRLDPHVGEERPGVVALWQPVALKGEDADDDGELGEEADWGEEGWLSRPDRMLADTLARQIRAWLEVGFPLRKGGDRLADAGDVLVLVRKRKDLAGLIVARLHAAGVPVAGVDRLRLGAPLGVKDLLAALRFAAQPFDDLSLANLLVSPLIGWSQEDLLEHGYRAKGVALWSHLRENEGPATHAAMEQLRALLGRADLDPPQALLHWLLTGPWQGRRNLVARLGHEVNDPLDELLNAAMAHAASHVPSLVGFLNWFDGGEGEVKREQGRSAGQVRVMTVHGAKGLQAPIVILADAADDPDASPPRGLELVEERLGETRTVPLPLLRRDEQVAAVRETLERAKREEREEHWRLLYVAMTRAEEALFIGGALGTRKRGLPEDSWFVRLEPLFPAERRVEDPLWGWRAEIGGLPPLPLGSHVPAPLAVNTPVPLPEWLTSAIAPEPRPPRPLAPSSASDDDTPDPPPQPGPGRDLAARRGTLLHKLIERLPEREERERIDAALGWLARHAADLPVELHHELAKGAVRVLADPQFTPAFGPGSLAEVPLTALVAGRMITGTIDRLVIGDETVLAIDFKTTRRPPANLAAIPTATLRQMAAYSAALGAIYPGRRIETALLYTETPRLLGLPDDLLAPHKPGS